MGGYYRPRVEVRVNQPVRDYMTTGPVTIEADESIEAAEAIMRERGIRHLPVVRDGEVAGVLTLNQLHLAMLKGEVKREHMVSRAMTKDPYVVSPETPVAEVVRGLADGKGCALVCEQRRVVGVFTSVDALRSPGRTGR